MTAIANEESIPFQYPWDDNRAGRHVLMGYNPIQHIINYDEHMIWNVAYPAHTFSGHVRMDIIDRNGSVYFVVTGEGNGPITDFNNWVGKNYYELWAFKRLEHRLRLLSSKTYY